MPVLLELPRHWCWVNVQHSAKSPRSQSVCFPSLADARKILLCDSDLLPSLTFLPQPGVHVKKETDNLILKRCVLQKAVYRAGAAVWLLKRSGSYSAGHAGWGGGEPHGRGRRKSLTQVSVSHAHILTQPKMHFWAFKWYKFKQKTQNIGRKEQGITWSVMLRIGVKPATTLTRTAIFHPNFLATSKTFSF